MTTPIPQPPAVPFIGNVGDIDSVLPTISFHLMAKKYGEIYQLNLLGRVVVFANTQALCNEVSDDKKFRKNLSNALAEVRNGAGDGLFTAKPGEENWGIAHRILLPAFGAIPIMNMMEGMRDICDQLLLKWERFGPDALIDPSMDFTKVALDAIALCSMSYRFNSFYTDGYPPFAIAMADFLLESFSRSRRPNIVQAFMSSAQAKYEADIKFMTDICNKIVQNRIAHPSDKKDLLDLMLNAKDPKTGKGLSEESIVYNLITFLIAGHETSSGTMAFMTYHLLKNPETMRKLQKEVDDVLQGRPIQVSDLSNLPYLTAVMRETLRLDPPAAGRSVEAIEDIVIGGKYFIKAGQIVNLNAYDIHRDPAIWGDDAEEFKPERMLDGKFEALPPNSWQPFGYGARGCIGRPFAWQEITMVMASVVQKFTLSMADPSYTLELKQTMTIKPGHFYVKAALRTEGPQLSYVPPPRVPKSVPAAEQATSTEGKDNKIPLYVYFGSNTGTSESFAQRIASGAAAHGFRASIGTLDSAAGKVPTDGPVVLVTASFEGEPADNAGHFFDWLSHLTRDELKGVRFAVFGCGNTDWVQTYQRIPKLCDELMQGRGGERLLVRGEGDVSKGEFFQIFDEWESNLWKNLAEKYSVHTKTESGPSLKVTLVESGKERATALRQSETELGEVVANKVISKNGPVKRHIEFKLPEGMTYRAGDYLAILPHNPTRDIHRVLSYFGLSQGQRILLSAEGPISLPVDKEVSLTEILSGYVELAQPATTRDLAKLIESAEGPTKVAIEALKVNYQDEVLAKRLSVLDILEKYKGSIKLSFGEYLQLLPSMRIRQYSISSSPLWNPQHVTLTISVIDAPSLSDDRDINFLGVATSYLSELKPGDRVLINVRQSAISFHPPQDPTTPIVMFCAGSGLAPMRAFMQERALQKEAGRDVGRMLLFYGCRSPEMDYLYGTDDIAEWVKLGILDARPAFSRKSENSDGCKYVQDRIWKDKDVIDVFYKEGAKFYTCGSGKIAKGIKAKLVDLVQCSREGMPHEEAEEKLEKIMKERYATDIFD